MRTSFFPYELKKKGLIDLNSFFEFDILKLKCDSVTLELLLNVFISL